jgi:uncharacterized protein YbjQ (UPF0145 family)
VGEERPTGAGARVAGIRSSGTWGSSLTTGEFAAIRSVGFEPVGQVFGAAVFGIAYGDGYHCPRVTASARAAVEAGPSSAGQLSERDELGPLAPLVRAMDQARRTAVERMTAQCADLGGDGVVGLRVSRGAFLLGGQEFTAIGTAVRAREGRLTELGGAVQTGGAADGVGGQTMPFTSDLSGQDFAKLIVAGWVPVGLVFGVAIGACHDDWQTMRQTRRWSGNREIAGWTEVVNQARREAGGRLRADVQRLGGEGAVMASMPLRVSVRDCPEQPGRRDHVIEASVLGTAVARFGRPDHGQARTASPALAVLPLVPQTRRSGDVGGR